MLPLLAAFFQTSAATGAAPPPPAAAVQAATLADGAEAIENGVDKLCVGLLHMSDYSLEKAQRHASDSGYARGAGVELVKLPEMLAAGSFSTLNFHANVTGASARNQGVAAFFAFHPVVCQVQVYGYAEQAARYAEGLDEAGWSLVDRQLKSPITAERWIKAFGDRKATLVVNRWTGPGPVPADLGTIINVFPGDNRTMGAFLPE